jgi:hypothetical protein
MGILDSIGLTGRSAAGGDYHLGDFLGPDSRFTEDLQAIDDYVRTVGHPGIAKHPLSAPKVADYDKWRQDVSWTDKMVFPNTVILAAKAKRDAINAAQSNKLPTTSVVESGAFLTPPNDPSKGLSFGTKVAIAAGGLLALVLLVGPKIARATPVGRVILPKGSNE